MRNWIILIAIIAIPSALAYTYFGSGLPSVNLEWTLPTEQPLVEQSNDNQIQEQSDNQTNPIQIDENFGVPARTVDEFTTDTGINVTVKEVMTQPFDPLNIENWDQTTAMRAEQILKEETDTKITKVKEQFTTGGLSQIYSSCEDLQWWYNYYYFGGGRNLDGLWSYNQKISDFLKQRMGDLGCSYYELPEGNKEKLDAQEKEIQRVLQEIKDEQAYYDELYGKAEE